MTAPDWPPPALSEWLQGFPVTQDSLKAEMQAWLDWWDRDRDVEEDF